MNIHRGTSKVLKFNLINTAHIMMDNNLLEEVERFIYLENVMNKQGGIDADIRIRIGKA